MVLPLTISKGVEELGWQQADRYWISGIWPTGSYSFIKKIFFFVF